MDMKMGLEFVNNEGELEAPERKLDEQKEELSSNKSKLNNQNELEQELKSLKFKLDDQKKELDSTKCKMNKQNHLLQQLKDKIECPVCMDIPRSGPVPVCPNGHFVCKECISVLCPTCRTAMGNGMSLLAATILENIEHSCKFDDCNKKLPLEDIAEHEKLCSFRIVDCPDFDCMEKVSLAKLVDHLKNSDECTNIATVEKDTVDWSCLDYKLDAEDEFQEDINWKMDIYNYSGETFAVFPTKSEGLYYFVVVMFASETECSKYKFEMIVHSQDSEASNSQMAVKFQGHPLSIDEKKDGLSLYCTSERFMTKILKNWINGEAAFSVSFIISKID